jgi:ribonuclease P protein component
LTDGQKNVDRTFPKSVRLRKRADFLKLFGVPDKFVIKGFLVVWNANELAYPRLGITVSKKVGCAVIRNRVKRFVREVYRHHRSLLPPVDINIIARREAALMDFSSAQRELEKALRHIGASTCVRALRSM